MTTTTDRQADTRTVANRMRTTLGWIDDNVDRLPPGMTIDINADRAEIDWFETDGSDQNAAARTLTSLLGPGESIRDATWTGTWWPAEGDRPDLTVHRGLAMGFLAVTAGDPR